MNKGQPETDLEKEKKRNNNQLLYDVIWRGPTRVWGK